MNAIAPTLQRLLDQYARVDPWDAQARLAKDLGRGRSTVAYWKRVGYIPSAMGWRVEALTDGEITAREVHEDCMMMQALRKAEREQRKAAG